MPACKNTAALSPGLGGTEGKAPGCRKDEKVVSSLRIIFGAGGERVLTVDETAVAGMADAFRESSLDARNGFGAVVMDGHRDQEAVPGADVVAMPAEVADADVFQVSVAVVAAMAVGTATVVADFTNTQTCDFVCLRELLSARRLADANFISLRLVVPAALWLIFELADVDVLSAYATLSEALTGGP